MKRNRCETFFSERDRKSIFLVPRPLTSSKKHKNRTGQNLPKKSKKREITRFDPNIRSIVRCVIP